MESSGWHPQPDQERGSGHVWTSPWDRQLRTFITGVSLLASFIIFTGIDGKPLIIAVDTIASCWEEEGETLIGISGSQDAWKVSHTVAEVRNALEISGQKVVRC